MNRRSLSVLVVVTLVFVAGCRVPSDSSPRAIPEDQVSFDLLAPSTTQPPPTLPIPTETAAIYLIGPERLEKVERSVPAPRNLGTVLATLVQGPTSAESRRGLRSSIDAQSSVVSTLSEGPTAVINMSNGFSGIGVQNQIAGLAQLVFTATELPGVQNVLIQVDSQAISVQRGDGSTTSQPLTRADYSAFAPLS
jgi:hypothetical protein